MKKQLEAGVIVSYLNIILNMAISIFLTPFLLKSLGDIEYGVYKTMQSFTGPLTIVSFGMAPLIVRNIVLFNSKNQLKEKQNFLFYTKVITLATSALIVLLGAIMTLLIPSIYDNLSAEQILLSKKLILFMAINLAFSIASDAYIGIVTAHERFVMANGIKTVRMLLRVMLIVLLIVNGVNSLGVVIADCIASLLTLLWAIIYDRSVLKERAKFHCLDFSLFVQCISFSFALFLQSIASQVNQNLDNVILGVMTTPNTVAMYSIALSLFTMFNTLVSAVGGVFAPRAVRLVADGATGEELTDFVVKPGRFQLMVAGLAIGGFVLFGKDFITLWLGQSYIAAYPITIILLVPFIIPLVETVTISILDAMLKRLGRSLILVGMCVINVTVSVVLINYIGYIGAAIGTAVSVVLGYGVLSNLYLRRVAHLNIFRMFFGIFKGTLPAIILSIILGMPLMLLPCTFVWFIIKAMIFAMIYAVLVYFIGMNSFEKGKVKSLLRIRK